MAVIGPAQVVRIAIWVFASGVQIRVIGSLVVLAFPLVFLGLMVTPPVFPAVALIVATYGAANGIMTIVRGLGLHDPHLSFLVLLNTFCWLGPAAPGHGCAGGFVLAGPSRARSRGA
jgi:hypothetical protein